MTDKQHIHDQLGELLQAFSPFYREGVTRWIQDANAPDNWFALNAVRGNDPEPITVQQVHRMSPYASIQRHSQNYASLVEDGLLESAGDDAYRLTDRGREIVEGFFQGAHRGLSGVEPLPAAKMNQLSALLGRLVAATLEAPEPVEKSALESSRWTDPGEEASSSARVDQFATDILRFRDDAHIAAWRPYGVSGRDWEALTFVWREEANTAEELAERLTFRGYAVDGYVAALADLADLGWVEQQDGRYQVTAEGKALREEAEEKTDRIYYASWSALAQDELEQLDELLGGAIDRLHEMALKEFWPLATNVSQAIYPVTRKTVRTAFETHFSNPATFFPMLLASGNAPEPFSAQVYAKRAPYINPERTSKLLSEAADSGYLFEASGGYTVTERGATALDSVNDIFYNYLGEIDPLDDEQSEELASLLGRLVDASLTAGEPADKWGVTNSHNSHPKKEYGILAQIDQNLDDLNAFRDDAHIASWKPHGVDGHSWEALTFVWRNDASTAGELAEKLSFRGYAESDYAHSLSELAGRGWIEETSDGYRITEKGQAIRQEVEVATDDYFYTPWSCLDRNEQNQLRNLLIQLKIGLEKLAEEEE